ncbi:bifunctional glycosyltransferase family 2 protein/CDP-glycerol:glycerophosphate glycerophosphotransferase [Staphylococcus pseudoxylosus]|uniref:bifunctional glycosyltransferase/CDP-glycerol:glycerophosphate glycerophosphotransferase n=1 Tax=Staphylococcus pseudoxylosus TaxID=2282419 RepID=UPI002DB90D5A|nr:bifunctional glycosyltransferase family 2 protein/CDP-glycerol:glycerophosphate glycerophosphotransferase [Staphylococcus pseudoxylosus]MEB6170262.1 bifunctional glycosyltransferase family 2 protein/CDP-glycerol:glycerophosphate glycerophosphotransferase [Staphylococcus pseudoxylosus]
MKSISVIVTYYNSEDYIERCLSSLKKQRFQDFELILVNDGSTDNSKEIATATAKDWDIPIKVIDLPHNTGHAHARNIGLKEVESPYFIFIDSDDYLASYALSFYMKKLNRFDALIAPIHSFTLDIPQYVDQNLVRTEYLNTKTKSNQFLRKQTVCNIIFKTAIARGHNLQFNEDLNIFVDWSFILEFIKYANDFVRISRFPFYIKGEIYDPFLKPALSQQDFGIIFNDYVYSFSDSVKRAPLKENKIFIKNKMKNLFKRSFEPSLRKLPERYENNSELLPKVTRELLPTIFKNEKPLFMIESLMLMFNKRNFAFKVNQFRKQARLVKNIVLRRKNKHRALYQLTDSEDKVKSNRIVFESFGGKNYSDSPKYIYEYMMKHHPNYEFIWVFKNPSKVQLPGSAKKVKKGSKAYYEAYSTAKYWVTNARLPLYLNKKPNQVYIQNWHGTPLKRLANDMKVIRMPGTTTDNYKRNFREETSRWDYLVSPNAYSSKIFETAFWMNPEQILEIGYPRNDVLVNHANDKAYIQQIKENLNLPANKKVIMYAPTWRDDEFVKKGKYLFNLQIDLDNLQAQLGDDYVVLLRMHYLISNALDLRGYEDFAIDVSNYSDISELYLISDCLITDYSSVMFDYGVLKRPQFFFAYDLDKYGQDLRGFYLDYHKDLPGPIHQDAYQLTEELKNLDQIAIDYKDKIDKFYNDFCSLEKGKGSKAIADLITGKKHE